MRFKLGLLVGFIAGFMVGARAGKERYDRIVARLKAIKSDGRVRQATDVAERSTRRSRAVAGNGLVSVARTIRQRTAGESTSG